MNELPTADTVEYKIVSCPRNREERRDPKAKVKVEGRWRHPARGYAYSTVTVRWASPNSPTPADIDTCIEAAMGTTDRLRQARRRMIHILITIIVAIIAYWLLVPLAGLPVIVGAIAAILILIAGLGGVGTTRRW